MAFKHAGILKYLVGPLVQGQVELHDCFVDADFYGNLYKSNGGALISKNVEIPVTRPLLPTPKRIAAVIAWFQATALPAPGNTASVTVVAAETLANDTPSNTAYLFGLVVTVTNNGPNDVTGILFVQVEQSIESATV